MLRRVFEGAVVAVVASLVTLLITDRADVLAAFDGASQGLLQDVVLVGSPMLGLLWGLAIALVTLGLVTQGLAMSPRGPGRARDLSIAFPSLPTTVMGAGVGVAAVALAVVLAQRESAWAIVVLAGVVAWGLRSVRSLRYRWRRTWAGL